MKLYGAGNAILHFRMKYDLVQPMLCEGICTEATLSRIETGEREYDSMISETLLSRLGKTANRYEFVLNDEDYRLYELRNRIRNSLKQERFAETEELLAEYEKNMPDQKLHGQFLKFNQAMLMQAQREAEENVIAKLREALNITRADFFEHSGKEMLFSAMEVKIIYALFLLEHYSEEQLHPLIEFMKRYYDAEEKEKRLIPFLYQLVYRLEAEERYREMAEIAEEAIDIICNGRSYRYLADFYFQRMKGQVRIYQLLDRWERESTELVEECNQIYYLYMIEADTEKMNQVEKFCEEKLQCPITK